MAYHIVIFFIYLLHVVSGADLNVIPVDLAGSGCDFIDGIFVGDRDIVRIHHRPRFNTKSTRNRCDVTIRTAPGRRLEYSVDSIKFFECGIDIKIYHDPNSLTNAKHHFECSLKEKAPLADKSAYNVLKLEVRRVNPLTTNYEINMRIINDMVLPTSEFPNGKTLENTEDDYQGQSLDPGIIAGIAIAGAIIIVALILLAIYLCIRARQEGIKGDGASSTRGESSVYTSGNSQVLFSTKERYPRGRYGSMEDIHSTTSSQEKAAVGAYTNPAYTTGPGEKKSERPSSIGRAGRKAGFENTGYNADDMGRRATYDSWQEDEDAEVRIGSFRKTRRDDVEGRGDQGSFRMSRKDNYNMNEKKLKSALKKPTEIEMNKVNTQPINGILKTRKSRSPNRSQTSSTEGSFDVNAMIHGYSHSTSKSDHPNIKHKPVIERRRSRSGTRSNRSASSTGSHGRRSQSADRKPKPKPNSRMYGDIFIQDTKPRSSSRNRARSNSLNRRSRGSDSVDSESSATSSSRRVNMNPGGKRVHIKGEETDI